MATVALRRMLDAPPHFRNAVRDARKLAREFQQVQVFATCLVAGRFLKELV
jgi:hypothetical protein